MFCSFVSAILMLFVERLRINMCVSKQMLDEELYRPNIDRKSSLKSAYLQNYTFRDKSTHVHNGSTLIYPISQEMHVKEDAGEYLHISSFHTLLSPVIYHITIMGDFFIKYRPF